MGTRNYSAAGLPSARLTGSGDSNVSGRRLFHIPVIHSQAEMGSLSPTIQAMTVQKLGAKGWERNVSLIGGIWTQIEQALARRLDRDIQVTHPLYPPSPGGHPCP